MIELNKAYNQDCLEGMKMIPSKSVHMILCDLPYGTTRCKWDVVIPFPLLWEQYERIIKDNGAIVLTGQQPFTTDIINSNRKLFKYELIWGKTQPTGFLNAKRQPLRCHENILVFYKKQPIYNPQKTIVNRKDIGRSRKNSGAWEGYNEFRKDDWKWTEDGTRYPTSVIKISNWNGALFGDNSNATKHPTEKPVKLFSWLIRTYTNEGDTVLDNCAGRGTTGESCILENRNFILFEKKKKFFDLTEERLAKVKERLSPQHMNPQQLKLIA